MVVASVSTETTRFDLKTVVGGWVELRELSHGQMLRRREMSTEQAMKFSGKGKVDDAEMAIKMAQRAASEFEFRHCIVAHNLEEQVPPKKGEKDPTTRPFDFSDPSSLDRLSPKVGEEIDQLISNMNNFDDGVADGSGNLPTESTNQ